MTHYFCIAEGMADFLPNSQAYHTAETEEEFRSIVAAACEEFERHCEETVSPGSEGLKACYRYDFKMPRDGENNYSQRVRIACYTDNVLDVIGMTADEFERESEGD